MNEVAAPPRAKEPDGQTGHRARSGQRRDQILDVALKLFAQKGMANVTTRQIAQAVGISQPSLYAHFRNADEIGGELCARAFDTLTARMERDADTSATARERLVLMGRAYIEFGLDNPDMYRVAFMLEDKKPCPPDPASANSDLLNDPALASGLRCFSVMHRVLIELVGEDGPKALLLAQMTWMHVHGLVSLLIARPEFPWLDRDVLIDAILAGLPMLLSH
ncbi:TetR/AcrR family transcriptional regulator [Novosphingobium sp.]|uniref:TetR/AcrR family transcriptional regulator n=1 Tax=Novosphingobium sp. TaxID=1874826 RepID=UPI0038B92CF4